MVKHRYISDKKKSYLLVGLLIRLYDKRIPPTSIRNEAIVFNYYLQICILSAYLTFISYEPYDTVVYNLGDCCEFTILRKFSISCLWNKQP